MSRIAFISRKEPIILGLRDRLEDELKEYVNISEDYKKERAWVRILVDTHVLLEASVNGFFNMLAYLSKTAAMDVSNESYVSQRLDLVDVISKIVMWIYFGSFDFAKEDEAGLMEHQKILGIIPDMRKVRTKLLHAHSNSNFSIEGKPVQTELNKLFSEELMISQLQKYNAVLSSMMFYLEHYDLPLTPDAKRGLKDKYLDHLLSIPDLKANELI